MNEHSQVDDDDNTVDMDQIAAELDQESNESLSDNESETAQLNQRLTRSETILQRLLCFMPRLILGALITTWNKCLGPCIDRIKEHNKKLNWWTKALIVVGIALIPFGFLVFNEGASHVKVANEETQLGHANPFGFNLNNLEPQMVFEINRHGARAPYQRVPRFLDGFTVWDEMLTQMGMR